MPSGPTARFGLSRKHVTTAERFVRPLAHPAEGADGADVSGDGAASDDDAEAADDDADSECCGGGDVGGELGAFGEVVETDDEEDGADEDEDSDADFLCRARDGDPRRRVTLSATRISAEAPNFV